MDRRTFLSTGAATFASLAIPALTRGEICGNRTQEDRYGAGPYHRENAPSRTNLASEFEAGQRIRIQGMVSNCAGPMAGINLDVWNATDRGCYESFDGCPAIPGHPEQYRLRGQMKTDAEGKYAFETILPGAYLNKGKYRPRHIHIILTLPYSITTPTLGEPYQLVTQLYFKGDPYIAGDYAADHPSAENRIIPLAKTVPALWQGVWNVGIPDPKGTSLLASDAIAGQFDVCIGRAGNRMTFRLPPNTSNQPVELRLYAGDGTLVKRSLQANMPVELDISHLQSGAYVVELAWWTQHGLRKESVAVRI